MQGWTPNFIPLVLQEAIDGEYFDELVPIAGPDAMAWSQKLAASEGILTGTSGGATFGVAGDRPARARLVSPTGGLDIGYRVSDHVSIGTGVSGQIHDKELVAAPDQTGSA